MNHLSNLLISVMACVACGTGQLDADPQTTTSEAWVTDDVVAESGSNIVTQRISGTHDIVCWITSDGTGKCLDETVAVPPGKMLDVSVGFAGQARWINSEGQGIHQELYERTPPRTLLQGGPYKQFSVGHYTVCWVTREGAGNCSGKNYSGQAEPPSGPVRMVASAMNYTCWLLNDGRGVCNGANEDGATDVPDGLFIAVSANHQTTCWIRQDGHGECRGLNDYGQANVPSGEFVQVASGVYRTCWIRKDGTGVCTGDPEHVYAPLGKRYVAFSTGWEQTCWMDEDDNVSCRPNMENFPSN